MGPAPPPGFTDPVGPTVLPPHCRTLRTRWTRGLGYTADRPPRSHPVRRQQRRGEGGGAQRCNHREQQRELSQPGGRRVGGGACLSWGWGPGESLPGSVPSPSSLQRLSLPAVAKHVCVHLCMWACTRLCMHVGMCTSMHVCVSVCVYACVGMWACARVCTCV